MKTLKDILTLSEHYLTNNGLSDPRYDTQYLLADYFNISRLELYLKFDRPVSKDEQADLRFLLQRRAKHEPLQYITGKADFFGYEFMVNSSVLIPRLDSESLIVEVVKHLKLNDTTKFYLLDIGSGSGCLSITTFLEAQKEKLVDLPKIVGMDFSELAVEISKRNAILHKVEKDISFFTRDIFNSMEVKEKFDIIISNPPYIAKSKMTSLDREVKDYEPQNALTDNDDGYKFYKRIKDILSSVLKQDGALFLEIGYAQSEYVSNLLIESFASVNIVKDMSGRDRVIVAKKFQG